MGKKKTTDEYISELSIQHPNIELLSEYNGDKNYITVKCTKHNHIWQTKPNWLKKGNGCKKCYDEKRGQSLKSNTSLFINKSIMIHGDKYNYSLVNYVNNKTKVQIICPEHGVFYQTPNKHLNGQGCPYCAHKHITNEMFINNSIKVHGNKYVYEKVNYVNNKTKVQIICPEHGIFYQTPEKHLSGMGCHMCNESKLEKEVNKILCHEDIERQKRFDWLGRMSLDFYLPKYNIAIECQGMQHFHPIHFFGGKERFMHDIENDEIKNRLCNKNGIKIIYIVKNNIDIDKLINNNLFKNIYNKKNLIKIKNFNKIKNILQ